MSAVWHCEYTQRVRGDSEDVLLTVGAFMDTRRVEVEIQEGTFLSLSAYLTPEQARAVAAALLRSADRLDGGAGVEVER